MNRKRKKRNKWLPVALAGVAAAVVLGILLGVAINSMGNRAASSSVSAPQSGASSSGGSSSSAPASSSAVSASVSTAPQLNALQQQVVGGMNTVLQRYAGGDYPETLRYGSESVNVNHLPAGVALPAKVSYGELQVQTTGEAEYDPFHNVNAVYATVRLPLQDNYALDVDMAFLADGEAENPYFPYYWARFVDLNGPRSAAEATAPAGGRFANLTADRIEAAATFAELPLPGLEAPTGGSVQWQKANGIFTLTFQGEQGWCEVWYRVGADGALTVEYQSSAQEFTGKQALEIGQFAFEQFKAALAAAGI